MIRYRLQISRSGFTLAELVVIFTILSILAVILAPVFMKYRVTSEANACINQKERVFKAISAYTADYDSTLPPATPNMFSSSLMITWPIICADYLKLSMHDPGPWNRLRCILDREDPEDVYTEGGLYCWWWNWALLASPGYNYLYLSPFDSEGNARPVKINAAQNPCATLMFAESYCPITNDGHYGYFMIEAPTGAHATSSYWYGGWASVENGWIIARHEGLATVVWLDGHVTLDTIDALSDDGLWDLE